MCLTREGVVGASVIQLVLPRGCHRRALGFAYSIPLAGHGGRSSYNIFNGSVCH